MVYSEPIHISLASLRDDFEALQGPPQHAGRHANSLPFAVISPQKPMGSQFFDDDVAAAIAATIRHYLATQPLDARRGPGPGSPH